MVPWIGRDLGTRVIDVVQADGVTEVEFHGQDGVLRCAAYLADPAAVIAAAEAVWGVNSVTLDASCGDGTPLPTAPTTAPVTTAPATVPATTVPTTTTVPATTTMPTTTVPSSPVLTAVLLDGTLVLSGPVATDDQRALLVRIAGESVTPENVTDQLVVDAATVAPDDAINRFVLLMKAMPPNLVSGVARWDGVALAAEGLYATADLQQTFTEVATLTGATAALSERPAATAEQATALEAELNALVAAEPILFDKGSTTVSEASLATLHRIAGIAERLGGVRIVVQGHTDSEGNADRNLTLSEERAQAVLDALVELGVPEGDLVAEGFGEQQLIVGADGVEDPDASRRVVFEVTTT